MTSRKGWVTANDSSSMITFTMSCMWDVYTGVSWCLCLHSYAQLYFSTLCIRKNKIIQIKQKKGDKVKWEGKKVKGRNKMEYSKDSKREEEAGGVSPQDDSLRWLIQAVLYCFFSHVLLISESFVFMWTEKCKQTLNHLLQLTILQ